MRARKAAQQALAGRTPDFVSPPGEHVISALVAYMTDTPELSMDQLRAKAFTHFTHVPESVGEYLEVSLNPKL